MLLIILGGILFLKGNLHWSYYRKNLAIEEKDLREYLFSISRLKETILKTLTLYGPFFKSIANEKGRYEDKINKNGFMS